MAIILPANTLSAGGFSVANSCRFNDGDSAELSISPSSSSNRKTWTLSMWVKRCTLGQYYTLWRANGSGIDDYFSFQNDDTLDWSFNSDGGFISTNRKFRDVGAWYHFVLRMDSTNATAGDRQRLYVNGVEETSFSTDTQVSQDTDGNTNNSASTHRIGGTGAGQYFDGYIAEVVLLDGISAAPTEFGEFDEDSPTIWKPKDVSGLTFGTNGFYLDFEDSSNLGNNAGSGSADFSESNIVAADQAVDTPTNNFCTLNPLHSMAQSSSTNNTTTYSEGNCKLAPSDNNSMIHSCNTIAMPPNGKWYMELKFLSTNVSYGGIIDIDKVGNASRANVDLSSSGTSGYNSVVYQTNYIYAGTSSSYGDDIENNDIMGIAFDADNGALYIALNGTWQNSGDPTSGASKTNAIDISGQSWYAGVTGWSICIGDGSTSNGDTYEVSFGGCPGFAVSSAQADDNGYGIFEHDVPAGYYAICTKNLAEFGG